MPNGYPDQTPVTWGRYAADHERMRADIDEIKDQLSRRRDRTWGVTTLMLAGLALPVIVSLITILIHHLAIT